jgi:hypothetical protein
MKVGFWSSQIAREHRFYNISNFSTLIPLESLASFSVCQLSGSYESDTVKIDYRWETKILIIKPQQINNLSDKKRTALILLANK